MACKQCASSLVLGNPRKNSSPLSLIFFPPARSYHSKTEPPSIHVYTSDYVYSHHLSSAPFAPLANYGNIQLNNLAPDPEVPEYSAKDTKTDVENLEVHILDQHVHDLQIALHPSENIRIIDEKEYTPNNVNYHVLETHIIDQHVLDQQRSQQIKNSQLPSSSPSPSPLPSPLPSSQPHPSFLPIISENIPDNITANKTTNHVIESHIIDQHILDQQVLAQRAINLLHTKQKEEKQEKREENFPHKTSSHLPPQEKHNDPSPQTTTSTNTKKENKYAPNGHKTKRNGFTHHSTTFQSSSSSSSTSPNSHPTPHPPPQVSAKKINTKFNQPYSNHQFSKDIPTGPNFPNKSRKWNRPNGQLTNAELHSPPSYLPHETEVSANLSSSYSSPDPSFDQTFFFDPNYAQYYDQNYASYIYAYQQYLAEHFSEMQIQPELPPTDLSPPPPPPSDSLSTEPASLSSSSPPPSETPELETKSISPSSSVFPPRPRTTSNIKKHVAKKSEETSNFPAYLSLPPKELTLKGFNDKIAVALRGRFLRPCMDLYAHMKERSIAPDLTTFHLLISAHIRTPAALHANQLFAELLEHKLTPTRETYNLLFAANETQPAYCDMIYAHMRNAGIEPDVDSVRKLIVAHLRHTPGEAQTLRRTNELLWDLLCTTNPSAANSPNPTILLSTSPILASDDVITSNSSSTSSSPSLTSNDCETSSTSSLPSFPPSTLPLLTDIFNKVLGAIPAHAVSQVYASMRALGIPPDAVTFTTRMREPPAKGTDAHEHENVILAEMRAHGFALDVVAYNTLLTRATQRKDAERCKELYHEMSAQGVEPDLVTYKTLTVFMAKMGEHSFCWEILQDMKKNGWK